MEPTVKSGDRVVGLKQSLRAIRGGRAQQVILAMDAQQSVRTPVLQLCAEQGITPDEAPTMAWLGKAFGISVGAAVVVVLRDE